MHDAARVGQGWNLLSASDVLVFFGTCSNSTCLTSNKSSITPRAKGEHYLEDARRPLEPQPIDEADEADGYFEAATEAGAGGHSQTLPNLKNKAVQRSETFMRELAAVKGAMRAKAARQKSGSSGRRLKRYLDTVDEERPPQMSGSEPTNLS